MPFAPVLRALACSVGLTALAAAAPASAESLRVHYNVTLIGLPIGSAAITGTLEPTSYKIEASAKVGGLASILSTSHGAATATGAMVGTRVAPATYATTSANSTMTRTIRIAMDDGNVTGFDISPPWDPAVKRVPITEADKRGILDPLSAFVLTLPPGTQPIGPAACDRRLPIFDGGVRFDLALSYVGSRHVKAKGYDGEAAVCAARYIPVSGQRVDSKAAQFMADNKNLETWVVPVPGTHMAFPYRISVRTQIGTVVIEADEFDTGTTHAAAH